MSEEQNDSPAFRLRPRRAPKSYYAVRLDFSANPAAFIREKPRNSKKRLNNLKHKPTKKAPVEPQQHYGQQAEPHAIQTKEEQERERRRALLQRDIADSMTTDVLMSPFMERLRLNELKPNTTYDQNYISLRIKEVGQSHSDEKVLFCLCLDTDNQQSGVYLRLHGHYANPSLVKAGKFISIAKFITGNLESSSSTSNSPTHKTQAPSMDPTDEQPTSGTNALAATTDNTTNTISTPATTITTSGCSSSGTISTTTVGGSTGTAVGVTTATLSTSATNRQDLVSFDVIVKHDAQRPLIPFVCITDMIEEPSEPCIELKVERSC